MIPQAQILDTTKFQWISERSGEMGTSGGMMFYKADATAEKAISWVPSSHHTDGTHNDTSARPDGIGTSNWEGTVPRFLTCDSAIPYLIATLSLAEISSYFHSRLVLFSGCMLFFKTISSHSQ